MAYYGAYRDAGAGDASEYRMASDIDDEGAGHAASADGFVDEDEDVDESEDEYEYDYGDEGLTAWYLRP